MEEIKNLGRKFKNKREHESIREDFLRPCLRNFSFWRRLTLGFSSSALKTWAGSFTHIIESKDIKIEILCDIGHVAHDFHLMKALEHCVNDKEKQKTLLIHNENILRTAFAADFNKQTQDDFKKRYGWQLLHYLIASEKLEIKFAINRISDEYSGLYHEKAGYFKFPNGEMISHYGTFNESESGHKSNNESVRVFSSYRKELDEFHLYDVKDDVDEDWNGNESVEVFNLSKETLKIIKEGAPTEPPVREGGGSNGTEKKLRKYQEDAIDVWKGKDYRGILEHATGSGKTYTALNCIKMTYEEENPVVIIGVPYRLLGFQWAEECRNFFNEQDLQYEVVPCWSDFNNWRSDIRRAFNNRAIAKMEETKILTIFIVVIDTLRDSFDDHVFVNDEFDPEDTFFIADECHNFGSLLMKKNLPEFRCRLGLSATPIIDKENIRENEEYMEKFFGGIIDEYTLSDALNDPAGPYLAEYEYHPISCDLSEDDYDDWLEDYKRSGWDDPDEENDTKKQQIFRRMNLVLSSMDSKLEKLEDLLKSNYADRKNSIVFCGQGQKESHDRNIDRAGSILRKQNWNFSTIATKVAGKNQSQVDRNKIMNNFSKQTIDSILAIKILDEGIDVPAIKSAYILASTKNRRIFVQRRGRVLRLSEGKTLARIYDFIVNPPKDRKNENGARKIIENEVFRIKEMAEDAKNKKNVDQFLKLYEK